MPAIDSKEYLRLLVPQIIRDQCVTIKHCDNQIQNIKDMKQWLNDHIHSKSQWPYIPRHDHNYIVNITLSEWACENVNDETIWWIKDEKIRIEFILCWL